MTVIGCESLFRLRTTVFIGILLVVSGIIALARDARPRVQPPLGLQGATPPSVTFDPNRLDFSDQVVGTVSKAKRIGIINTGGKALYIESVTVAGVTSSDFTIVKDTCAGATIAPNRACIIDVIFEPSETNKRDANLKLTDNALDSPQTMRLTGNGINSNDVPQFTRR